MLPNFAAGIGSSSTGYIDAVTFGNRTFFNFKANGYFFMQALAASGAGYHYGSFTKLNQYTSGGYQVPAGKKLNVLAFLCLIWANQGSDSGAAVGYGDTDVGMDSAAAPTNFKKPALIHQLGLAGTFNAVLSNENFFSGPCDFQIPAGKYPTIEADCSCTVRFVCQEENA